MIRYTVGGAVVIADGARTALESDVARRAEIGDELRDAAGVLLAVRESTPVGDAWRVTSEWPEAMTPVDLEEA